MTTSFYFLIPYCVLCYFGARFVFGKVEKHARARTSIGLLGLAGTITALFVDFRLALQIFGICFVITFGFGFAGFFYNRWKHRNDVCGATDWAPGMTDEGLTRPDRIAVCNRKPHTDRWHSDYREGQLWAEWSGDDGPIPKQELSS